MRYTLRHVDLDFPRPEIIDSHVKGYPPIHPPFCIAWPGPSARRTSGLLCETSNLKWFEGYSKQNTETTQVDWLGLLSLDQPCASLKQNWSCACLYSPTPVKHNTSKLETKQTLKTKNAALDGINKRPTRLGGRNTGPSKAWGAEGGQDNRATSKHIEPRVAKTMAALQSIEENGGKTGCATFLFHRLWSVAIVFATRLVDIGLPMIWIVCFEKPPLSWPHDRKYSIGEMLCSSRVAFIYSIEGLGTYRANEHSVHLGLHIANENSQTMETPTNHICFRWLYLAQRIRPELHYLGIIARYCLSVLL